MLFYADIVVVMIVKQFVAKFVQQKYTNIALKFRYLQLLSQFGGM